MILGSLMLAIAGFGALAGAMHRHAKQIGWLAVSPGPLRLAGSVLLAASFFVLLAGMDWRMAAITWIGQAGLAATVCVVMLSLKPHASALPIDRVKPRDRQGAKAQPNRTVSSTSSVNGIDI